MPTDNTHSLRLRLRRIVLLVLTGTLLCVAAVVIAFQVSELDANVNRVAVVAQMVARNAAASIECQDSNQATLLLQALGVEESILSGAIIVADGSSLAVVGQADAGALISEALARGGDFAAGDTTALELDRSALPGDAARGDYRLRLRPCRPAAALSEPLVHQPDNPGGHRAGRHGGRATVRSVAAATGGTPT